MENFANKDVYIDIVTIPTKDAYYAMHVPNDISVTVETAHGNVLHTNLTNAPHGEGDFLVCTIQEDGEPDLSDIWVCIMRSTISRASKTSGTIWRNTIRPLEKTLNTALFW